MDDTPSRYVKVFVVFNPVAGVQNTDSTRQLLEERFLPQGWEWELYETTGEESVPELVQAALARGYDLVIAAGGDGTVAGVAAGLVNSAIPMAIVPVGTGNALARELNIPLNVEAALDLLVGEHQVRHLDGMEVDKRLFLLNVGVGISSRSMRETRREQKRRFGNLAYVWNILRTLGRFKMRRFRLTIDGRAMRVIASEIMLLNSGILGIRPLPSDFNICPDDGRINIYVARPQTPADVLRLAWNLLIGRKTHDPRLQLFTAERSVVIESSVPASVQADGEVLGVTPARIQIIPQAVRVVAPVQPPRADDASDDVAA